MTTQSFEPDFKENNSNTVKLALFKAPGDWMDKVIRIRTSSIYSHCEIVLPDGSWYTSHIAHGGVVKVINHKFNHDVWDFIDLPDISPKQVIDFYEQTKKNKYNLAGVLGYAIGLPIPNTDKWHCAQWCGTLLGMNTPVLQSPHSVGLHAAEMLKNHVIITDFSSKNMEFHDTVKKRPFGGKLV